MNNIIAIYEVWIRLELEQKCLYPV